MSGELDGKESARLPRWPEGIKRTKQRQAVFRALAEADTPLTAMELATRLERQGEALWLSTIYRVLEIFVEKEVVLRTLVLDSGIAIYELARQHHRHYAVCVLCNRLIPLEVCPMERFPPQFASGTFHVLGHRLQVYGYCGACGGAEAPVDSR